MKKILSVQTNIEFDDGASTWNENTAIGGSYSMEISIIRKYGYVNFVNSNVTWASIIASPLIPNDGFVLAGYRISR